MTVNSVGVMLVIFTSALGHIFGHTDIGLAIGSGMVLIGSMMG